MMPAMAPEAPAARTARPAGIVLAWALLAAALVAIACLVPVLPANPDLYLHLAWAHQVMRCLAAGSLPLWLPDLNAGFGSPGLRLASPLGPVVDGVLGLALGDAARGLRLGALLAAVGVVAVYRACRARRRWWAEATLVLASPAVLFALLGRSAWSEVLALPLLAWLLETAVTGWPRAAWGGVGLAALWLLHAPSTLAAVGLALLAQVLRADARALARVAASTLVAAGLTAWHWLPLLDEAAYVGSRAALTGGIYRAARNVLGSSEAHDLGASVALGWCAVGLLAALLAAGSWRTAPLRTALATLCVAAASPLALPLWRLPGPHELLQFPWRLLLPATLLIVPAVSASLPHRRGSLAAAALLLPALLLPRPELVLAPALSVRDGWQEAGAAIHRAIGGNPLLVDAEQHRPPAFALLAGNLAAFGTEPVRVLAGSATWRVARWRPLDREVEVRAAGDAVAALRLLDYPGWSVEVDGSPRAVVGASGAVGVAVPPGDHRVRARWRGNPLADAGLAVAAATAALLLLAGRHRRAAGGAAS
jgi:hypothetical protein